MPTDKYQVKKEKESGEISETVFKEKNEKIDQAQKKVESIKLEIEEEKKKIKTLEELIGEE